ncbi:uncharacterized protein I206_103406 [Kwoniella pini CBS 10737]|uniref:IQ domain-containing GTPase activating protein n=1 Tax=Kwoniella pini CBS 10737 TaxID=1296096 RepID=A0A1B9I9L8_9TREE|nr:IQ domain-containing GTPase activating protein [Kwoniella pini CBS 10737]OCF52302.1 IQ domain-containing GTPase activating protein [Kwoniella pini CBS 10737]
MSGKSDQPTEVSPPRSSSGLGRSPSIFSYQTRILNNRTPTSDRHVAGGLRHTPNSLSASTAYTSLASIVDDDRPTSPPSTPIRRAVAKMVVDNGSPPTAGDEMGKARLGSGRGVGLGLGMGGRPGHAKSSKSVDLVRNQWQAKIDQINNTGEESTPHTPRSVKSSTFSPPLPASPTLSSSGNTPSAARTFSQASSASIVPDQTGSSVVTTATNDTTDTGISKYRSAYMAQRAAKRNTVYGASNFDSARTPSITSNRSASSAPTPSIVSGTNDRPNSPAVSSYASMISPNPTGESSAPSVRGQTVEERLAIAKANALRRRDAREKAKAGTNQAPAEPRKVDNSVVSSEFGGTSTSKPSSSADVFSPPVDNADASMLSNSSKTMAFATAPPTADHTGNSTMSRSAYRSIVTAPTATLSSRYIPSGLSASTSAPPKEDGLDLPAAPGKDKYGSISKTDRRRLGRHLPRIASGGEESHTKLSSEGRRVPSTLGKSSEIPKFEEEENTPPTPVQDRKAELKSPSTPGGTMRNKKSLEILVPSTSQNQLPTRPSVPSTPNTKRRSAYMPYTPKSTIGNSIGPTSPRPELTGAEMKGLMSAVGSLPARGMNNDEEDGVTGMSNRLRLTKSRLPPSASSASVAPAPLPSRRLAQTNWMDKHRHAIAAYEYLCHVGEAQQWIEGCLEEELPFGVTEMEEGLRDGVVLAKLARVYEGEAVVRKIWTESKHRYKQSDNINYFLNFVRNVSMPETFIFELTDLYNKKNIPKVIFCIHILSHLLARLGKAQRIGNLVGQFEFTTDQLAATQKGLQGVAMPNFGDASNSLAKESSWEPEEPTETEDERRDRELLECETSIIDLHRHMRGRLARMHVSRTHAQLELAEPIIVRFQARARAALIRQDLKAERQERSQLQGFARAIQAVARGHTTRRRWTAKLNAIHSSDQAVIGVQAQARGMIARIRRSLEQNRLDKSIRSIVGVQAQSRGHLARRGRKSYRQVLAGPEVIQSVSTLQAVLRGRLQRQVAAKQQHKIHSQVATFTSLQSQLRGALVRRRIQAQEQKMDDATDYVVAIQAVCRGVLARQKKRSFTSTLQQVAPAISSLQAIARGRLAKQAHKNMQKALAKVEVAGSVGGLQAFLRTRLAKKQNTEQKKKLEFVQPDVIGFQAVARGYLARQEYREWRDYLHEPRTLGALVFLQSLVRGFLARRRLYIHSSYIHRNVDKIVKIQALWRGRVQRQMYEKLVTGYDVDVPTVQNYMHLLDDTESDFADQVRIEALRGQVVDLIRENQGLETEVKDLDTKIALIINNKMSFQELARAKHRSANDGSVSFTTGNNDPFGNAGGIHLDRVTQRKLELFEQLFFMLQTRPEYISRLLRHLTSLDEAGEKEKRLLEGVTMILFGFGHERREEYLFHKLLQLSVHEEVLLAPTLHDLAHSRFPIISVAAQYIKPTLTPYIQDVLYDHIMRIVGAPELDLCTDPVKIYQNIINAEETATGVPSQLPRDRNADQILQENATARAIFIRNLQELRALTEFLITGLLETHARLPYTIRLLAREALLALQTKFPEAPDEELVPVVARTVVLPFILPAIIAPEQYGLAPDGVGPQERRNLAEIANLVTHVAGQQYTDTPEQRLVRTPLEAFISASAMPFREWILDVADVEHAEGQFHAHELFESTIEAKPIKITRNDIYGTLSALIHNVAVITAGTKNDPISAILRELEGAPIDYDRSKNTVTLRLTNRLGGPQSGDPDAVEKADWVQAKRHVLAVLRVQTGKTLYDVLVTRPEEIHEQMWIEEVHRDIALENARLAKHGLPPTPAEQMYQIESIRSLPFHEVKSRAIEFCMKLERSGKLSREDDLQGLLVSISSDIRQKHHLRKMRKDNLAGMIKAYEDMSKKKLDHESQIKTYHDYIDGAMAELQAKGKKKPMFMSKQYRHQKSQQRQGKQAKFGSYKYTAAELYEKRILLSVNQFSPRQFDKLFIVIGSNEVGVFKFELSCPSSVSGGGGIMGEDEIRMEDLLGAQYENKERLDMFEGQAAFSLNMLIHQINKSERLCLAT